MFVCAASAKFYNSGGSFRRYPYGSPPESQSQESVDSFSSQSSVSSTMSTIQSSDSGQDPQTRGLPPDVDRTGEEPPGVRPLDGPSVHASRLGSVGAPPAGCSAGNAYERKVDSGPSLGRSHHERVDRISVASDTVPEKLEADSSPMGPGGGLQASSSDTPVTPLLISSQSGNG